jgi:hypothetical protein
MEVFQLTPSPKPKRWPSWFGLYAWSESGLLFIDSAMAGIDATRALVLCSYDNTEMIAHGSSVLVPIDWAMKERPELHDGLVAFKRAAELSKGAEDRRN